MKRPIAFLFMGLLVIVGTDQTLTTSHASELRFEQYPAEPFIGKTKIPTFTGKTREYRGYRTRITNGMNEGPNFAGHYSVIQFGCGTTCTFVFIGNNKNGTVVLLNKGGDENPYLELDYRIDSRLLVTQWGLYGKCEKEYFEIKDNKLLSIGVEYPELNEYGECKVQLQQ